MKKKTFRTGIWLDDYSRYLAAHEAQKELVKGLRRELLGLDREEQLFDLKRSRLAIEHNNVIIYACLGIEGFLNQYGVMVLGERWYKENLERVGICEKLSILCAICFERYGDDVVLRGIRKRLRMVFDERNSIVHVKSKELHIHNFQAEVTKRKRQVHLMTGKLVRDLIGYFKSQDPLLR